MNQLPLTMCKKNDDKTINKVNAKELNMGLNQKINGSKGKMGTWSNCKPIVISAWETGECMKHEGCSQH